MLIQAMWYKHHFAECMYMPIQAKQSTRYFTGCMYMPIQAKWYKHRIVECMYMPIQAKWYNQGCLCYWLTVAAVAGGEADEAQAQEDHEDVTTKEDAKPDGLVSAYWETIGHNVMLASSEMIAACHQPCLCGPP
jgi:hypothetical protein